MGLRDWFSVGRQAPELRSSPAGSVTQSVPISDWLRFFGIDDANLPHVTIDSALNVPAVADAVGFLSSALAALPMHLFRDADAGAQKIDSGLGMMLRDAVNPELSSYDWREWHWVQIFTSGRALTYIERNARGEATALWPMDPAHSSVERVNGRKQYRFGGKQVYDAADVIDVAWMPKSDLLGHYGPINRGAKAIALALAMQDYSSKLFAKGGLPPLGLRGAMPAGGAATQRMLEDVKAAIDKAAEMQLPIAAMPAGYELTPLGFDPQKGQLVEGKKFVISEIARIYRLPPVFLQDLEHGTFSNTEQQDLHLVKHTLTQWCVKFEQQLNLKLFGPRTAKRYVKHNIDGLLRGDFRTRMEGYARAVQSGVMMPSEARQKEDLPFVDGSDRLMVQGATVPLDQAGESVDDSNDDGSDIDENLNGAGGASDAD